MKSRAQSHIANKLTRFYPRNNVSTTITLHNRASTKYVALRGKERSAAEKMLFLLSHSTPRDDEQLGVKRAKSPLEAPLFIARAGRNLRLLFTRPDPKHVFVLDIVAPDELGRASA